MKVQFSDKPSAIMYMALPDGGADVWLRKNITQVTIEGPNAEPSQIYEADEVYFRTNESLNYVEENFEKLFNGNIPIPPVPEITLEERVAATEAALLEFIMGGAE